MTTTEIVDRAAAQAAYDAAKNVEIEARRAHEAVHVALAAAEKRLAAALAAEQDIRIGDERQWRGRRYSVSGFLLRWDRLRLVGRLIRKDNTLGVSEQELW